MEVMASMKVMFRHKLCFIAPPVVLVGLLTACQSGAEAPRQTSPAITLTAAAQPPAAPDPAFTAWLEEARADAIKRGIKRETVDAALGDITPIQRIIELDSRQPEFSNTFTRYLTNAVTAKRVAEGRELMQKHAALLARLERQYGVPGRFLVAFWGLETNFGRFTGDYPVVNALVTLAYEGRRGAMFRDEMFNALTILDRGHITLDRMKGSYAGAMGQTQFMPSTFLRYAVDQDGNGHIDVWGSIEDALGSAANYLSTLGWNGERTWGREVSLPTGFNVSLASLDVDAKENIKTLAAWDALGVRRVDGGPLPGQDLEASLVLPAGGKGPAFLLYDNYRVILKYNRSAFYAIAIGHLADRVIGAGGLAAPANEGDPLRRDDVMALQEGLVNLGFLKTADGVMGSATRQAVRAFQASNGLTPDGYADRATLEAVRKLVRG